MNVSYSGLLPRPGLKDVSKFDSKNDIVNGQSIDLRLDQLIQKTVKISTVRNCWRQSFILLLFPENGGLTTVVTPI